MQTKDTQTLMLNLEKWRVLNDLTQTEMAEAIGMSLSNYNKLVTGQIDKLSVDSLRAIYDKTGLLCHVLMEIFSDDYLKLSKICKDMTPSELHFMLYTAQNIILMREGKL